MKKLIAIFILRFFLTQSSSLFSQSWEYGMGIEYIEIGGSTITDNNIALLDPPNSLLFGSINFGINIPLYSFNNEMTLGLQTEILLGVGIAGGGNVYGPHGIGINLETPTYFTFRCGAGSNRNSKFPLGFGIGTGYQFTGFIAESINDDPNDKGFYSYFHPNLLAEISIDLGNPRNRLASILIDNLRLRFESQLNIYEQNKYSEQYRFNYGYSFYHSSISLVYFKDFR